MTGRATTTAGPAASGRRRDSGRSREALLEAGRELFEERGYDRTTVRELGERAGLDPALIARYFGSKAGLYIAVLHAESGDRVLPDLLQRERLVELLTRLQRRGPGPVYAAAVRSDDDPQVRTATRQELHRRLVDPLLARLTGDPAPALTTPADRLRAELAVAAFAGIVLGRTSGAFPALAAAPVDEVVALTSRALQGVLEP